MKDGTKPRRDVRNLVRPHLLDLPPYEPVEPIDVMARRLGIPEDQIAKLDGNENPYGASPLVRKALGSFPTYNIYPDPAQYAVRAAVGEYVGVDPEQVLLGSGSDEMLNFCAQLFLSPGDTVVSAPPTFGMYEFLGRVHDARVVEVPRREDFSMDMPAVEEALDGGAKMLYLASPNNPTGNSLPRADLRRLLQHDAVVVCDEAYAEFAGESFAGLVDGHANLVIVRTFSKWAGLAGLRAGYAVFPHDLVEIVWRAKIPYNLGVAAEQAVLASLADVDTLQEHVRLIIEERERMADLLLQLPWLRVYPSEANFLLCEVRGIRARLVRDQLRKQGILVRYFDVPGLRNCIRISVGLPEHTDRLLEALREIGPSVAG